MIVVPIRVKIGLRPNGHADHPAWESLPMVAADVSALTKPTREQIDRIIGKYWLGSWHYDKTSGHQDDTVDSPRGQQWGMLFVTRQFATEAIATFPALVTEMTRSEAVAFYNTKVAVRMSAQIEDESVLSALLARRTLMVQTGASPVMLSGLDARIAKALDPDDPEPGVRRNPWANFTIASARWGLSWDPSVLP